MKNNNVSNMVCTLFGIAAAIICGLYARHFYTGHHYFAMAIPLFFCATDVYIVIRRLSDPRWG